MLCGKTISFLFLKQGWRCKSKSSIRFPFLFVQKEKKNWETAAVLVLSLQWLSLTWRSMASSWQASWSLMTTWIPRHRLLAVHDRLTQLLIAIPYRCLAVISILNLLHWWFLAVSLRQSASITNASSWLITGFVEPPTRDKFLSDHLQTLC